MRSRIAPSPARRRLSGWLAPRALALIGALIGVGVGAGIVAACSGLGPHPAGGPPLPEVAVPHLEERALLLLLADRKVFEPYTLGETVTGDVEMRELSAVALGRIGDPRGRPLLEGLLVDRQPQVRRAAAFSLGLLGVKDAGSALLAAARDADRETGRLAVEALARLGAPLAQATAAVAPLPEAERRARLLPSLFRFKDPGIVAIAAAGLSDPDPSLHARAAYALARNPLPEGVPRLRQLLSDPDPQVRAWAARGIGLAGEGADLKLLRPLVEGGETASAGPLIEALRAAARLVSEGKAAAPPDWKPLLAAMLADSRPGVRITALEAAGAWLLDDALGEALAARAAGSDSREREVALLALARAGDPRAIELTRAAARSPGAAMRAIAAQAAGQLHAASILEALATDASPAVRAAVLQARLDAGPSASETAAAALADPDAAVRATALEWLAQHPELPTERLGAALTAALHDRMADARVGAVRALVARAKAVESERQEVIGGLSRLVETPEYLLRREVMAALAELGLPRVAVGPAAPPRDVSVYRQILQETGRPRMVDLVTRHGTLRIRLDCPEAPLTCLNLLHLATQGFYEGLTFHRVVPDFVVQGGDPRGDGWGGPGYELRDEVTRRRFERGAIGMALSGPDTAGSQFFVTLAPQPHLDGTFTAFGQVVAGDDVLDQIVQGETIERVVEVPSPATPGRPGGD